MRDIKRGERHQVIVVRVVDGDTLNVQSTQGSQVWSVRLYAIDAPERGQPHSRAATTYLRRIARDRLFTLEVVERYDRYGRIIGILRFGDHPWHTLNHLMVAKGLAFALNRYGTLDGINDAQELAQAERIGMWATDGVLIRPWDYRDKERREELALYRRREREAAARLAERISAPTPPARPVIVEALEILGGCGYLIVVLLLVVGGILLFFTLIDLAWETLANLWG